MVSRGQLLSLGMSDRAMQYRVRRTGPWQKLLPGIYLAATGIPSLHQKELAALLYAGPGSLLTGPMALMHHSIRSGSPVDVIDILVPVSRRTGTAPGAVMTGWPRRASSCCTSRPPRSAASLPRWRR